MQCIQVLEHQVLDVVFKAFSKGLFVERAAKKFEGTEVEEEPQPRPGDQVLFIAWEPEVPASWFLSPIVSMSHALARQVELRESATTALEGPNVFSWQLCSLFRLPNHPTLVPLLLRNSSHNPECPANLVVFADTISVGLSVRVPHHWYF